MFGLSFLGILLFVFVALIMSGLRVLNEYQRGVVLTLGRYTGTKGPGLVWVWPMVQKLMRVDLRTVVMDVPPQDVITRDNVTVKVNAVIYFRVVDPARAILQVVQYYEATSQLAQTTLRSVLGQHELDSLLAERELLNRDLQAILDKATDAWASRCRRSRSNTWISTRTWCARSRARRKPNASAARK